MVIIQRGKLCLLCPRGRKGVQKCGDGEGEVAVTSAATCQTPPSKGLGKVFQLYVPLSPNTWETMSALTSGTKLKKYFLSFCQHHFFSPTHPRSLTQFPFQGDPAMIPRRLANIFQ